MRKALASQLLADNRMVVEASADMMQRFPLAPGADAEGWLRAAAKLLGDAVELRQSRATSPLMLVVKDRAVLFNYTQDMTLEDMATKRKLQEECA